MAEGAKIVAKSVRLLQSFTREAPALTAAELSRRTGLSVSSVYRFLSTFREHGLIEVDPVGRFCPGLGILELASVVLNGLNLRRASLRPLEELQRATGATTLLTVLRGDRAVCVQTVESDAPIRVCPEVGQVRPLHAGAPGKVLLAFMPGARRDALLTGPLVRVTKKTIVDPLTLGRQLARIRARGYAITDGEFLPAACAVAVPVRDRWGNVVASMAIAAPGSQLTLAQAEGCVPLLVEQAGQVSAALGYVAGREDREGAGGPDGRVRRAVPRLGRGRR